MSIIWRPACWLFGHTWEWLVRAKVQRCSFCDAIRRVR